MKVIVHTLEETLSQVHIAYWVNGLLEHNTTRKLTVSVAPVMLDTFKMPLVHNDNDSLGLRLIDLLEEVFVSFVNKDFLKSWEEDGGALDVPVD